MRAVKYYAYTLGARLNSVGEQLYEQVKQLVSLGLVQIDLRGDFFSVAPWNARSV
jgi:hypothetical protein